MLGNQHDIHGPHSGPYKRFTLSQRPYDKFTLYVRTTNVGRVAELCRLLLFFRLIGKQRPCQWLRFLSGIYLELVDPEGSVQANV